MIVNTAWGAFGIVARAGAVVETFLPGRRGSVLRTITERWPDALESVDTLPQFQRQVIDYFGGKRTRFTVRTDLSGLSPFRQAVLEACRRIPYGQTASYADLARAAGRPGAARAAGSTMANNPIPLVIPCHRVLRSDGSIGGFSSPQGVKQKMRLLSLENALSSVSSV
ncbi:MAG: methylated-DNA--[protein]-cysteine S-methyltransferase [Planctomycetota bacterium]